MKFKKCEFCVHKIIWLGYELSKTGVKPTHSKIEDILQPKPPKSLTKLRSFIGSINHLGRFIQDAFYLAAF